jgi:hypothetical protein
VAKRLIELVNRHPTDPRAASILEALGDREIATTRRLLRDRLPPQITIGAGPELESALPATDPPPTTRRAALASLRRARELYRYAIGRAVGNGGTTVADLFALEEKILASFYFEASDPKLSPEPGLQEELMCELGESAFRTHAVNTSRLSRSPTDFALALIGLGDWQLLCSNNGEALRTYRTAREVLRDYGVPADVVSLDGPGELLVFDSQPAGAKAAQDYRGYVDVSLVIGKYGDARKIDIVGQSASTPKAVEKRLKSYLASNRFRPRFVDGELVRGDRVALRYYYDY